MKAAAWSFAGIFALLFFWSYIHPRTGIWHSISSPQDATTAAARDIQDELNLQLRKQAEATTAKIREKGLNGASQAIDEELGAAILQYNKAQNLLNQRMNPPILSVQPVPAASPTSLATTTPSEKLSPMADPGISVTLPTPTSAPPLPAASYQMSEYRRTHDVKVVNQPSCPGAKVIVDNTHMPPSTLSLLIPSTCSVGFGIAVFASPQEVCYTVDILDRSNDKLLSLDWDMFKPEISDSTIRSHSDYNKEIVFLGTLAYHHVASYAGKEIFIALKLKKGSAQ